MNTIQMYRQRDLLQSIASDIADVEQIALGSSLPLEGKQQLLGEKIRQIRQTATAGLFDEQINAVIMEGYKADCLDCLLGFLNLSNGQVAEMEDSGQAELSDTQLQLLAMAATSYAERVSRYLQLKSDLIQQEVDNGR